MSELFFQFSLDLDKEPVLCLSIQKEPKDDKHIYASTLLQARKDLQPLYEFILEKVAYNDSSASRGGRLSSLCINKVNIPAKDALSCIRFLALARKLVWEGRVAVFDPFSVATAAYMVLDDGESLQITATLHVGALEYTLADVQFIFPFAKPWVLLAQKVVPFDADVDKTLLAKVFLSRSLEFKAEDREGFLKRYADDDHVKVVVVSKEKSQSSALMLPRLFLKDPYGATAELYMNYPGKGLVLYQSPSTSFRLPIEEQGWEKDLLETGYQRKIVGNTHYFCPLDQVTKTLNFLLEIGWHIVDCRGRKVCKMTDLSLSLASKGSEFVLRGSFHYQDHKVDIQNVIGSFSRKEAFVELAPGFSGLLDFSKEEYALADLVEAELTDEGIYLRKGQLGLVTPFLHGHTLQVEGALAPRLQRLLDLKQEFFELPPERFSGTLYPYQQEGLSWLQARAEVGLGALLADDMGLGKTVQVLALIASRKENLPVLIIAPTSLIFNWEKEIEAFLPRCRLHIYQGKDRVLDRAAILEFEVILTSYAYLRLDGGLLSSLSFAGVILDEAQLIKNPQSQLAKSAFILQAKWKIAMTGTPVENRVDDLWSLFHFLEPSLLGSRQQLQKMVSSMVSDSRYKKLLAKKIGPFLLRRTKDDVGLQLPEKVLQTVYVDMTPSQRNCYDACLIQGRQEVVSEKGRFHVLKTLLRLRQVCCHPSLAGCEISDSSEASGKLNRIMEDIFELVQAGNKVLVFSQFTSQLKMIKEHLEEKGCNYLYLDGSTKDRQAVVSAFQGDPTMQVFLMSLKAGGVGLNLTAADYVFLCDPWWNEAAERQAIDRAYRLGRQGRVVARRYVTAESVEEKIMHLKEHKLSLSSALLDQDYAPATSLSMEDLVALLD